MIGYWVRPCSRAQVPCALPVAADCAPAPKAYCKFEILIGLSCRGKMVKLGRGAGA